MKITIGVIAILIQNNHNKLPLSQIHLPFHCSCPQNLTYEVLHWGGALLGLPSLSLWVLFYLKTTLRFPVEPKPLTQGLLPHRPSWEAAQGTTKAPQLCSWEPPEPETALLQNTDTFWFSSHCSSSLGFFFLFFKHNHQFHYTDQFTLL